MLTRFYALTVLPPAAKILAVVSAFVARYIFNDWEFLAFLLVLVTLDTTTGVLAAVKNGEFRLGKLKSSLWKAYAYSVILIMTHGLTNFEIHEAVNWAFKFFDALAYTLLMGLEAFSILGNIAKIDPALLPAPIRAKLQAAILAVPMRVIDSFTAQAKIAADTAIGGAAALPPAEPDALPTEPTTPEPAPVEAAG